MAKHSRRGFTLIELAVVVGIVGLLSLFLLSAVQSARESSRTLECRNRLKNIGIAVNQHVTQYGILPAGYTINLGSSYLLEVIQFMESSNIYNSANLSIDRKAKLRINSERNFTVLIMMPSTLTCPSDSNRTIPEALWSSNYAGNCGRSLAKGEGVFVTRGLSPRDITDGFSNTVASSEWIVGSGGYKLSNRYGSVYSIENRGVTLTEFASICDDMNLSRANPILPGIKGRYWICGGIGATQYNHIMTPNKLSCSGAFSAITSGSFHPGGANVLALDGSVHFAKDSINPAVWSALGTRSMGDTTNNPFGL